MEYIMGHDNARRDSMTGNNRTQYMLWHIANAQLRKQKLDKMRES